MDKLFRFRNHNNFCMSYFGFISNEFMSNKLFRGALLCLFDIFNTKSNCPHSGFKKPMSVESKQEFCDFLNDAIAYIKTVKIENDDGTMKSVFTSKSNTGFMLIFTH